MPEIYIYFLGLKTGGKKRNFIKKDSGFFVISIILPWGLNLIYAYAPELGVLIFEFSWKFSFPVNRAFFRGMAYTDKKRP